MRRAAVKFLRMSLWSSLFHQEQSQLLTILPPAKELYPSKEEAYEVRTGQGLTSEGLGSQRNPSLLDCKPQSLPLPLWEILQEEGAEIRAAQKVNFASLGNMEELLQSHDQAPLRTLHIPRAQVPFFCFVTLGF